MEILFGAFLVPGTIVMAVSHANVSCLRKAGLLLQPQRDKGEEGLTRSFPSANL